MNDGQEGCFLDQTSKDGRSKTTEKNRVGRLVNMPRFEVEHRNVGRGVIMRRRCSLPGTSQSSTRLESKTMAYSFAKGDALSSQVHHHDSPSNWSKRSMATWSGKRLSTARLPLPVVPGLCRGFGQFPSS